MFRSSSNIYMKIGDTLLAIRCKPILLVVTPVNGNEITIGNDLINEHCRHMLYDVICIMSWPEKCKLKLRITTTKQVTTFLNIFRPWRMIDDIPHQLGHIIAQLIRLTLHDEWIEHVILEWEEKRGACLFILVDFILQVTGRIGQHQAAALLQWFRRWQLGYCKQFTIGLAHCLT